MQQISGAGFYESSLQILKRYTSMQENPGMYPRDGLWFTWASVNQPQPASMYETVRQKVRDLSMVDPFS